MIRDKSIERKKSTRSKSHSKQKPLSLAGCPLYPLQNFQGFFSSSLTNRALSTCSTAAWTEHAQTDTDTPLPLGLPKAQLFKHAWQTLSSYASPSVSDSVFLPPQVHHTAIPWRQVRQSRKALCTPGGRRGGLWTPWHAAWTTRAPSAAASSLDGIHSSATLV